jgi:hypothetical protein
LEPDGHIVNSLKIVRCGTLARPYQGDISYGSRFQVPFQAKFELSCRPAAFFATKATESSGRETVEGQRIHQAQIAKCGQPFHFLARTALKIGNGLRIARN